MHLRKLGGARKTSECTYCTIRQPSAVVCYCVDEIVFTHRKRKCVQRVRTHKSSAHFRFG